MRGLAQAAKRAGEMAFNVRDGAVNWFPGHMVAASRTICDRLKLADLVPEVRDARVIKALRTHPCIRRLVFMQKEIAQCQRTRGGQALENSMQSSTLFCNSLKGKGRCKDIVSRKRMEDWRVLCNKDVEREDEYVICM